MADMSDRDSAATEEEEETTETEAEAEIEAETESEATLDIEAAEEREATVEELRRLANEQQERIEELEDVMLDMSARAAHNGGTGVCPDCHGPVIKISRWFRSPRIKCTECERVFHEY